MATMIDLEMIRNPHTVSGVVISISGVDIGENEMFTSFIPTSCFVSYWCVSNCD